MDKIKKRAGRYWPADVADKVNELVENYNYLQKRIFTEPCPVCHGQGATTDHHDPCTECGGSGRVGGE